jgi:hypothetical protein
MCTVQGCPEEARFLLVAQITNGSNSQSVPNAYCDAHAAIAAKRLGHSWPISERKPVETVSRGKEYLAG